MALPPEPNSGALMQTLRWSFRPLVFLNECRNRLGDTFSLRFLGFERPMVMISDPAAIKALYTERSHGLPPGRNIILEPVLGPRSVLLLEGAEHLARRRLMLPPFHGERMRSYDGTVREIVAAEVDSWPLERPFPIHPRMQAVTLEVILRVVFGVAEGPRLDRLRAMLGNVLAETASPTAQLVGLATRRFGGGPWARFEGKLREVDELLLAEIAEHRAKPDLESREDILSMLMCARFEDGTAMDDRELRDQLMTLLLAGHETTATALAWSFYLLARHPEILARVVAEADAMPDGPIEHWQPERLELTTRVFREALRLYPPLMFFPRRTLEEVEIAGVTLPPRTLVFVSAYAQHRRADVWPDPDRFDPDRFLPEREAERPKGSYLPFSAGPRFCIGMHFAMMEGPIVLATLLRRWRFEIDPARTIEEDDFATLRPKGGVPAIVRARA